MIVLVPIPLDDPNMVPAVMPSVRRLASLAPGSEIRLMSVLDPKAVHGVSTSEFGQAPPVVAGNRVYAFGYRGQGPDLQEVLLLAVTGYGQPEDCRRALEAGFNVHLTKPVDIEQIRRLLA